jgi:hypothetical protein
MPAPHSVEVSHGCANSDIKWTDQPDFRRPVT